MSLTGYVGGESFNAVGVRKVLAQYPGKHVDIMINSGGGSLAEGLAICGAFRDHGDVTVHLRGLCASAATVASMGAKSVEIAPEAMYLVHQVSVGFFDWASRNASQLSDFIEQLQKTKDNLDAMDSSLAQLYAARCKKPVKDLVELMHAEKWISANDALVWGFVDAIAEHSGKVESPKMTKAQADAFRAFGLPLPPVELEQENKSLIKAISDSVVNAMSKIISSKNQCDNNDMTNENQSQAAQPEALQQPENNTAQQPEPQPENDADKRIEALEKEIASLKARVPGASTASVNANATQTAEQTNKNSFFNISKEAKDLFDSIP